MTQRQGEFRLVTPPAISPRECHAASEAVEQLALIYDRGTEFLCRKLERVMAQGSDGVHYRACYPEVRVSTSTYQKLDSRLAFGHVAGPGEYSTTITRPDLFRSYLEQQIGLLMAHHGEPVVVGASSTPIPVHFAVRDDSRTRGGNLDFPLRDVFDVPDLAIMNDKIVNGTSWRNEDGSLPLAPFTAPRIDYSLARLRHYTATRAMQFQSLVLFTNYQYYMSEFEAFARLAIADPESGYTALVTPGNHVLTDPDGEIPLPTGVPQMPAYHLKREDGNGISLVNIGVGPANAKTATDHVAVLRPRAWLMLGHCAGLRSSQRLGDYVLAHAYLREDKVLDQDLPVWIPVPALAEVQKALENAVAEITQTEGYDLKRIMRTGTVATLDNRNWELRAHDGPITRLSQSRAIALDMESGTIAANGFRFRVPYGTLLCVSDKPLQGVLKLPGMANEFYQQQVSRHLRIGIRALESLREMPMEFLHSRKLRSFEETAFL